MTSADAPSCPPPLRALPSERVVHRGADGIAFHDPLGIAEPSFVPREFLPVLVRLDGTQSFATIARAASRELRARIEPADVQRVVAQLDERLLLHSETFERVRDERLDTWLATGVREAAHAGSAGYPDDAATLRSELARMLNTRAPSLRTQVSGLIAPHIDLARGEAGYAAAFAHLLAAEPADLYVLFGTGHQGPGAPVTGLPLDFCTPLGRCVTDRTFVSAVHDRVGAQRKDDLLLHRSEHSLEFSVLWLQFVHEVRSLPPPTIAAFLCGALPSADGDPTTEPWFHDLTSAFRTTARERSGRVVYLAAADLAHVGPRFDDEHPVDQARCEALERDDRARLLHLEHGSAGAFHRAVEGCGNEDRVCSAPAITLCAELAGGKAMLLHYGQAVADDGSEAVSYCAAAFPG